jgi:hypothetical protein
MPKTLEALGCEYGTLESRPVDGVTSPLEILFSWAFCACLGVSNIFDAATRFGGGFVMRRALLTERLDSLDEVRIYCFVNYGLTR